MAMSAISHLVPATRLHEIWDLKAHWTYLSTPVLATAILLAPLGIGLAIGREFEDLLVWTIMGSLPILIGTIAQRMKNGIGVLWWLLTFVTMTFFYRVSAVSASPPAENPVYVGLAGALLFGAWPLLVIVAIQRWQSLWLIAGLIGVPTGLLLFEYIADRNDDHTLSYEDPVLAIILAGLIISFYFLPSIIAEGRGHRRSLAIFVLNILLGWTLLGWIAALAWACTSDVEHQVDKTFSVGAPSIVPAANKWTEHQVAKTFDAGALPIAPAANGWIEDYDMFEVTRSGAPPDQNQAIAQ